MSRFVNPVEAIQAIAAGHAGSSTAAPNAS
jgi:hypothetical protein